MWRERVAQFYSKYMATAAAERRWVVGRSCRNGGPLAWAWGAAHRSVVARMHFKSCQTTRWDRSYCALTRWSIRYRCLTFARILGIPIFDFCDDIGTKRTSRGGLMMSIRERGNAESAPCAMNLRTRDPHRAKETRFSCRTGFRSSARKFDPADWPDLSPTSYVPASSRRQFSQTRTYFFFFATLRVFFAVFFTALFAFLAFLAMLTS